MVKKKRTVITPHIIKEINELWHRNHNYAQTGRELGISGSTVKKYVIKDYVLEEERKEIPKLSEEEKERLEKRNEEMKEVLTFLDYLEDEEEKIRELDQYLTL